MKRFIISVAASLAGVATMSAQTAWDGTVAESFAAGDGTALAPYEISAPSQLAYLASMVNSGTDYSGVYFIQTADLDLNGSEELQWTPIANRYNIFFGGIYDGGNHTVSNLYINDSTSSGTTICGLFGNCNGKSRISNLVVRGSITVQKGMAGMIVSTSGEVSDCVSLLDVNIVESGKGGGIVQQNGGTIARCIFAGKSFGGFMNGGIVASNGGKIQECLNLGLMEGNPETGSPMLAGIAATNSGTVADCINAGSVYGYNRTGGIVASQSGSVTDCLNYGPVFGYGVCGAILGYGTGSDNLYYDVQTSAGLLTGEEYYGKGNLRIPTSTFISGEAADMVFTDASRFSFMKGLYPQITALATSGLTLTRLLSSLAAVPVISSDNDVWAAMRSDLSVPASVSVDGKTEILEWTSLSPEMISFNGTTAKFTETGKDSDFNFYVEIAGTGLRKYFRHHRYEVFSTMETPEYYVENGVKHYKMESIGNFAWVAALTNGLKLVFKGDDAVPMYSSFKDCELNMTADIDFSGHSWVPIAGYGSSARYFAGTLNGNGFAIKGLTIDNSGENETALFARIIGTDAGIRNLRLKDGYVKSTGENTGALVGYLYLGDVEDCVNESCEVNGEYICGGLIGKAKGVNVLRCANMADINCTLHYAGGLIGSYNSDNSKYSVIDQSFNTGKIVSKSGFSGGIAAITSSYSTISHSYNRGEITADGDYIGGITATSSLESVISNCYNAGEIRKPKGLLGDVHVGEIAGNDDGGRYSKNFYDADKSVSGGGVAGNDRIGVTGLSTDELKSSGTIEKLGMEFFSDDVYGINDGYPTLKWQNISAGINAPSTDTAANEVIYDAAARKLVIMDENITDVTVCNSAGLVVRNYHDDIPCRMDVSDLPCGIYIVVLHSEERARSSFKFMTE